MVNGKSKGLSLGFIVDSGTSMNWFFLIIMAAQ